MNFLSNLIKFGEIIKGYSVDQSHFFTAGTQNLWMVCEAKRNKDSAPVSMWLLKKGVKSPGGKLVGEEAVAGLRQEPQNLLKIRHPSFLRVLEPVHEDAKVIAFVTEKVETSLFHALKQPQNELFEDDLELKQNCRELLVGLQFLHESVHSAHLNVCPETVLVLPGGKLRLAGLAFLRPTGPAAEPETVAALRDPSGLVCPNLSFLSPAHFRQLSPVCDVFAFTMVLCAIFNNKAGRTALLPESLETLSESQTLVSQVVGYKRKSFLDCFPAELRPAASAVLQSDSSAGIEALGHSEWFDDAQTRLLDSISAFLGRGDQEQRDLVAAVGLFLPKFSRKTLLNRVLPFLSEQAANQTTASLALAALLFAVEKRLLDPTDTRRLIWPALLSVFQSKNVSSQLLFALLFHIDKALEAAEPNEVERTVYPFFVKCLLCGNLRIQKLAFARLPLIVDKLQAPETKKQLLLTLAGLLKSGKTDLIALDLRFLADNLALFDQELVGKQLLDEIAEFFQSAADDSPQLADLVLTVLERVSRSPEASDKAVTERLLTLLCALVCRANVPREAFDEANALIARILRANESRRQGLPVREPYQPERDLEAKSVRSLFEAHEMKTPEVDALVRGKPAKPESTPNDQFLSQFPKSDPFAVSFAEQPKAPKTPLQIDKPPASSSFPTFKRGPGGLATTPKQPDYAADFDLLAANQSQPKDSSELSLAATSFLPQTAPPDDLKAPKSKVLSLKSRIDRPAAEEQSKKASYFGPQSVKKPPYSNDIDDLLG